MIASNETLIVIPDSVNTLAIADQHMTEQSIVVSQDNNVREFQCGIPDAESMRFMFEIMKNMKHLNKLHICINEAFKMYPKPLEIQKYLKNCELNHKKLKVFIIIREKALTYSIKECLEQCFEICGHCVFLKLNDFYFDVCYDFPYLN